MGIALQLQPTAVLLVPFLVLYVLLFRPPLHSRRYALLGLLALLAVFTPSIVHDLTHGLVETRAWLAYAHHGRSGSSRAIGPTLARILLLLQRLVGVRQAGLAAVLGLVLSCSLCARAILRCGDRTAPASDAGRQGCEGTLARLLLLFGSVCLAGYLFFGAQLQPHYMMPLFPVPALALGLLAGRGPAPRAPLRLPVAIARSRQGAAAALAVALAVSNVAHTWQAGFLPDRYQITLLPNRSNQITLAQMRQVEAYIVRQASGRRFNLLFTAPDDSVEAYTALLLAAGGHLSGHLAPLGFVVVQPPTWPAAQWPGWVRSLTHCADAAPAQFAAALVWTVPDRADCTPARPAGAANRPNVARRPADKEKVPRPPSCIYYSCARAAR
jgi:hypothetical protein